MDSEILWKSDLGDGTYQNPILYADYSDPDVIRVGNYFYMTASSFNYTPGLPILVSEDLVNWELKNYAIRNIGYDEYKNPNHARGIWAPAIRYHDGRFWICYGMPDEGIFMIHAEDPLGAWSAPVLLLEGKGYIDPCPFWDEDGKAYIIHGYARSRIGFKSFLGIFPISSDASKATGEDKFLYDGTKSQPTIEGPKVYKRDGWYYIFAPAGGVKQGWQTVLRSKHIEGPYEERIVLEQGSTEINGPHQGGLVDTSGGEEWFIHFQDRGFYGRITHLQPVCWSDGWPVIGVIREERRLEPEAAVSEARGEKQEAKRKEAVCGEPCLRYRKPGGLPKMKPMYLQASDDFRGRELGLQWQWLGNHERSFYSLTAREGRLRLYSLNPSGSDPVILWKSSNVVTQKFVCPSFKAEIKLDIQGLGYGEQAGCAVMGGQYMLLAVRKQKEGLSLVYGESMGSGDRRKENILMAAELPSDVQEVIFRLLLHKEEDRFVIRSFYCLKDDSFKETGHLFVPSDHTWVGAKIGLFSVALDTLPGHGYADFKYIKLKALGPGQ